MASRFNFLAPWFLAQLVHLFAGAWIFTLAYVVGEQFGVGWQVLLLGIFMLGIVIKESVVDPAIEQNQPFLWEGVKDMLMYPVGFLLGGVLIWVVQQLAQEAGRWPAWLLPATAAVAIGAALFFGFLKKGGTVANAG